MGLDRHRRTRLTSVLDDFDRTSVQTSGAQIHVVQKGTGPPLLLIHGYPQTHAMWHAVAPPLAEDYTVVCPDLRGYGASSKPAGDAAHAMYSKRALAQDMIEVMNHFGFERFKVVGHDRGGRVAHRLALDHGDAVERVAVLDIVPTLDRLRLRRQKCRDGDVPLVLPQSALRPSRTPDRRRPDLLPALASAELERGRR